MNKIKNSFVALVLLLLGQTILKAQVFEKGKVYVNLGYGIGLFSGNFAKAYSSYQGYSTHSIGPISLSVEKGINENISLGGFAGYYNAGATWNSSAILGIPSYEYNYSWSAIQILFRGAYHFKLANEKLDLYGGAGIGYTKWTYKWESNEPTFNEANYNISGGSPIGISAFGGARYMFKPNFGVYAEGGWGLSAAQIGLTFKL